MAVQSREIKEPRRHNPTAIIPPGRAAGCAIRILQVIAFILIVMSTFGNYVTFIGGWDRLGLPANLLMVAAAVAYQAVFSALQWGTKAMGKWLVYGFALFASAIPSFLTYNAWAGPYISIHFGVVAAWVLIGLAAIGADALPEWVLVG